MECFGDLCKGKILVPVSTKLMGTAVRVRQAALGQVTSLGKTEEKSIFLFAGRKAQPALALYTGYRRKKEQRAHPQGAGLLPFPTMPRASSRTTFRGSFELA